MVQVHARGNLMAAVRAVRRYSHLAKLVHVTRYIYIEPSYSYIYTYYCPGGVS